MTNDDTQRLRSLLSRLPDPAGAGDLVSAGRVTLAQVKGGTATIVLDVGGLPAEQGQALEAQVREVLGGLPGIAEVRVALTAEKKSRAVIAVASGKGGVGKSTVAANLAIAMARAGRRVGLVDADIYGPSQTRILGEERRPELVDGKLQPVRVHGIGMLSIGQMIEPGKAVAWRGPMTAGALANLMDADWGDTEILVVDLPPGTGDVQMSLVQKWKPVGAMIVSTPQDLALIDATRAIDLFNKLDVPIIGLVENMAGYQCPSCGEVSDPFGTGGAEAAAGQMGLPFLGRIPLTLDIRKQSDAGQPPAAGESAAGLFAELGRRVLTGL